MNKTRRRYDREFKISVVAELESGKLLAQIAREYGIHPGLIILLYKPLYIVTLGRFIGILLSNFILYYHIFYMGNS